MDENSIKLAIVTQGGSGSLFIYANFIVCLKKYLEEDSVSIYVYGSKSKDLNNLVFGNMSQIAGYFSYSDKDDFYKFDAAIQLSNLLDVIYIKDTVKEKSLKLYELLNDWKNYINNDPDRRYCVTHPQCDYASYVDAINNGNNVLNVLDSTGRLGINKEYVWKLVPNSAEELLIEYGLEHGQYITIQRGATPESGTSDSTKIWSVEKYEECIRLLKAVYPDKKIVQLGRTDNSVTLNGTDISLLDKTTWNELAYVLKHAWLHIDGECGMVHLRAAMHAGPSVVLFGSTPIEYYGYDDNINIKSDACRHFCARMTNSWLKFCPRGYEKAPCMEAITPGLVLMRIQEWDRINQIRNGEFETAVQFKNNEFYAEDILLDDEYKKHYLDSMKVFFYEKRKIKLAELTVNVMTKDGFKTTALPECPAYKMALGDINAYSKYMDDLHANYIDSVHSIENYQKLLKTISNEGYDKKSYILVDKNGRILDGQHRASYLLAKNGCEYEDEVYVIYAMLEDRWEWFPFEKIKPGSRVYIYCAGAVGQGFLDQINKSSYCEVLGYVDREAVRWNLYNPDSEIKCIAADELKDKEYDYVIIASHNDNNVLQVLNTLTTLGVNRNKIVSTFNDI